MGQAFRRASGSVRRADLDPSSSSHLKNVGDRRPPAVPVDKVGVSKTRDDIGSGSSGKNFLLKVLFGWFLRKERTCLVGKNFLEKKFFLLTYKINAKLSGF